MDLARRHCAYGDGQAGPTVLILHGAGDCADSWAHVCDRVSRFARVVTYDRAGLGFSEVTPPASADGYLSELEDALEKARVPEPFLLVGHSLGALLARLYARRHPQDAAAMLLVDATPEAVSDDRGVKTGFAVSAVAAGVLRLLAPFGLTRLLLAVGRMPLYPEQHAYRAAMSPAQYRRWIAAVCRNFAGA